MSLINEALKRTRDASFQAGTARPATVETGYRVSAVDETAALSGRSGVWVSLLVVVMAGVAVLVFSLRVAKPSQRLREALVVRSDGSKAEAPAERDAQPILVTKQGPAVVPVVTPLPEKKVPLEHPTEPPKQDLPPKASELPAPPTPAPTLLPESPKFALQGITSGPGWREAMINGYALREGDELDGARVTSIEPRRVKLQAGDREILLRMP
jgi:hypothetical protein